MATIPSRIYTKVLKPRSKNPDDQRRELIFNILVGLFVVAATIAMVSSLLNHLAGNAPQGSNSLPSTAIFLVFVLGLLAGSRKGFYKVGAYTLIALVWTAALQLMLAWSFELPMAQLVQVLVIVVAGVIISSRASIIVTAIVAMTTIVIGYIQTSGQLAANTEWLTRPPEFSDAIGQAVVLMIIGGVAWLSNKEIDALLRRSWRSEAALAKQRDQLEVTVAQRTRELEQEQLKRTLELQHLAEFGRVSASLIHDLSSPLTAASLNLEQADNSDQTKLVHEAMVSLRHIENYIASTRKQLQGATQARDFAASQELGEVVKLLQHQASTAGVALQFVPCDHDRIFGDPVALHRVVANLIINGIQAYSQDKSGSKNVVVIKLEQTNNHLRITVQDFGVGIRPADLGHIFKDFYSTKKRVGRGLGIGLAAAKRVIENDYQGSITVTSKATHGTLFTMDIPYYEAKSTNKHKKRPAVSRRQPRH
jgi:signal transduction histidine kinase